MQENNHQQQQLLQDITILLQELIKHKEVIREILGIENEEETFRRELRLKEYEANQQEKRDKMNERILTWTLFFSMVGGFGFASIQPGQANLLVALYPLLSLCLARHVGHRERTNDQVKNRLFKVEENAKHPGSEHQNREPANVAHRKSGSHTSALRDAILLTQAAASVIVIRQFPLNSTVNIIIAMFVSIIFISSMVVTWRELRG